MKRIFIATAMVIVGLAAMPPLSAQPHFQEITVAPGETLWAIANKYLKDPTRWPDIVKANNMRTSDPTVALPGTKLKVPVELIKEEYRNALLMSQVPEVKFKRKGQPEWRIAKTDMLLHYDDSLRTMEGGQARIQFPSREIVQINENSYVIIRPERILQEIQLMKGDVRASRAKVVMPQGTVVLPKQARSDYQAKIREDETEVVFVYKGRVDVTAKGKTVTVSEGFGTEVPKAMAPQTPKPLAEFPDFNPVELAAAGPTPGIGIDKNVVTVKPPVTRSEPQESRRSRTLLSSEILVKYRLQLATDDKFSKIVLDKTIPTGDDFDLKKERIPDATYLMRVAFIDALGTMGAFSEPSQVIKDTQPPIIKSLVPADGQVFVGEESYCDVIGMVEGAAIVAVNDEVLFISPTGRFNKFMTLIEGENKIKILARDLHGNETIIVRTVTYNPGRTR